MRSAECDDLLRSVSRRSTWISRVRVTRLIREPHPSKDIPNVIRPLRSVRQAKTSARSRRTICRGGAARVYGLYAPISHLPTMLLRRGRPGIVRPSRLPRDPRPAHGFDSRHSSQRYLVSRWATDDIVQQGAQNQDSLHKSAWEIHGLAAWIGMRKEMAWCNPALAGSTDWRHQPQMDRRRDYRREYRIPLAGTACRP
jgi:hypothetical protein